jgi:hypothetical protein
MANGLTGESFRYRLALTRLPKAPRGGSIDCEKSFFLDIIHVDIAFGDCVSVGGFRYSLIFVNRATRYNWIFGLNDLSKESILLAFRLFWADAESYARCFYCDCDFKLFGTTIKEHLVDHNSNIVAAAAGCQSSNGLIESHWKIMVHMTWAYLMENQMPRSFWFYAVSHSARMMNAIPGKFRGKWLLHFFLYTVWGMTNKLGFLSWFVTFIVNGRATFLGPTARHIQWMVSLLAAPPLPTPCWYTTLAQSSTTNRIPIAWIRIVFPLWLPGSLLRWWSVLLPCL